MYRPNRRLVVAALATAVALFGIVVRVGIPAFRDYTIRAQVAEGVALANAHKSAVIAAWKSSGHDFANIHTGSVGAELEKRSKYVTSIDVVSGAIVITYGGEATATLRGRTLTIVPALDAAAQSVEWQCGRGAAPDGFEPIFEEPGRLTDIPDVYLPASCHGD